MKQIRQFLLVGLGLLLAVSTWATTLDLTAIGSSGTINNAIFQQFNYQTAGSGSYDTFLQIHGGPQERGYNTNGSLQYETQAGHTHAIQLSEVPVVKFNGVNYREFLLDIDEPQNAKAHYLSLDELKIYLDPSSTKSGAMNSNNFKNPVYDMGTGNDIILDAANSKGNGEIDMRALIPDSLFVGPDSLYVYLYSKFGKIFSSGGGFEEWGFRTGEEPLIPEPGTLTLFGLGLGLVGLIRIRRTKRS